MNERTTMDAKTVRNRHGVTAVELMVVLLVTLLLGVLLSTAIARALNFHQSGREEAFVRENLCLVLERCSDALGMAKRVESLEDGRWRAHYRLETGGVSFETNRFIRVTSTEYYATNLNAVLSVFHAGERADLQMAGDATLDVMLGMIDDVSIKGLGGVRKLEIHAHHPVKIRGGVITNTIVVSRPFRVWNQTP